MIESLIIQAGALGIVGFVVFKQQTKTDKLIKNNTIAITKVYEVIRRCKK